MTDNLLTSILSMLNLSIQQCFSWFVTFFVGNWYYFFMVVFLFTLLYRFFIYPIVGQGHGMGSDSVRKKD